MHAILVVVQTLVSLRVPLLGAAFLIGFPVLAFTKARTLFWGLFDQTPLSLLLVTLAVFCLAGTVVDNAHLITVQAIWFGLIPRPLPHLRGEQMRVVWLAAIVILTLPTLVQAIRLSRRQRRSLAALVVSAVIGLAVGSVAAWLVMGYALRPMLRFAEHAAQSSWTAWLLRVAAHGDKGLYAEHVLALCALVATTVVWAVFGICGYFQLGKPKTVPALAGLLMLVMTLTWPLAAATFYLDHWHIPTLLIVIVAVAAVANGWSRGSDHRYLLIDPASAPEPQPAEVLTATGERCVIVAAAEGGGIQAAAWTAQVLEGLRAKCGAERFDPALRMISAVSGGSVGTACYVDWLLNPGEAGRPSVSAAKSSLDEVSWGLAWPDFLRAWFPWFFGWMIDRGVALQRAWSRNCSMDPKGGKPRLLSPLSGWRQHAAKGTIPAVVLNSTVVENGFRLLMSTSALGCPDPGSARMDASEVNRIGDKQMDISVVTAARLSASFTWVTPGARAAAGPGSRRPHLVDGGYYDNYGMATLVEWLDQALTGTMTGAHSKVAKVMVLQIHSSPTDPETVQNGVVRKSDFSRGWLFQLAAPFQTLLNVRSSGQIAHNNIELNLLEQKWASLGVQIESLSFTFPGTSAPLSWHLTEEQKQAIRDAWTEKMGECAAKVQAFLETCPAGESAVSLETKIGARMGKTQA